MKPHRLPDPSTVARQILRELPEPPRIGLELGSGFAPLVDAVVPERVWRFEELEGFPRVGASGHAGSLVIGRWHDIRIAILNGRSHYYEGEELSATTFPIRVLAALGVNTVLFTNAAGGIRHGFRPGDFMACTDHLNFLGVNPLRGPEWPGRKRFVDLTQAYDPALRQLLAGAAKQEQMTLHTGVYLAVSGPSYETPAEIRAFRRWGADAVGMSTVPGVIVARQCGLRVAALSCLTNVAAGLGGTGQEIDHEKDVLKPARDRSEAASRLIGEFIRRWQATQPPAASPAAGAGVAARRSRSGSARRRPADST